MGIIHVVMFEFKEEVSTEEIADVSSLAFIYSNNNMKYQYSEILTWFSGMQPHAGAQGQMSPPYNQHAIPKDGSGR